MFNKPAIKRFRKSTVAVAGLIIVAAVILMATMAYVIAPDNTPYANNQQITLSNLAPGSKVSILNIKKNRSPRNISWANGFLNGFPSQYTKVPYTTIKYKGDSIYVQEYGSTKRSRFWSTFHIVDVLYSIDDNKNVERHGSNFIFSKTEGGQCKVAKQQVLKKIKNEALSCERYWLGTDRFGRDMLSRIIVGSRISISVGFIAVGISLLIGILLGLTAGYWGGLIDRIIMWLINVVWSIPTLLLVIAISMVLGKGYWQIFIAVGITMWVEVARVVRGQVKSIKQKDFVQAARVLGFSNSRIMLRHILPNTTGPLIVISAANFATAILLEAGLSFLGIGVQPPMPSWGNMIRDHYGYIVVDHAYLAIAPGIAIMLLVWAFNVLGYGLRDTFDVKS